MFPCIFDPCRTRVSQSISLQPFSSAKKTSSFHFVEVLTKLILSCYRYPNIFVPIILDTKTMVVQWWEHSPPTSVARVRILASTPYVGWVCCWFSPLLREVFLRVLRFSPLLKNQHFQIAIRSGMHGHVSTSSYTLLSDPWVNKLQQITTNGFLIPLSVTKCQFTALDHQS